MMSEKEEQHPFVMIPGGRIVKPEPGHYLRVTQVPNPPEPSDLRAVGIPHRAPIA